MSKEQKRVAFAPDTGLGPVANVAERGKEALGIAAETILSHIPGTAEHELRAHGQILSSTSPVGDIHVADGTVSNALKLHVHTPDGHFHGACTFLNT